VSTRHGGCTYGRTDDSQISYDLAQLPPAHRLPLRDSLLTAVRTFASGPRVVLTQVCIALADLALQLNATEWADPTTSMIELFGKEPVMAGALLEFLQVIAEEYCSNLKLDVRDDFGRGGKGPDGVVRGMAQAEQVVGLLSMYVSAPGTSHNLSGVT
jgi:transportin-3